MLRKMFVSVLFTVTIGCAPPSPSEPHFANPLAPPQPSAPLANPNAATADANTPLPTFIGPCAAPLIAEDVAIASAFCLAQHPKRSTLDLPYVSPTVHSLAIASVVNHPQFSASCFGTLTADQANACTQVQQACGWPFTFDARATCVQYLPIDLLERAKLTQDYETHDIAVIFLAQRYHDVYPNDNVMIAQMPNTALPQNGNVLDWSVNPTPTILPTFPADAWHFTLANPPATQEPNMVTTCGDTDEPGALWVRSQPAVTVGDGNNYVVTGLQSWSCAQLPQIPPGQPVGHAGFVTITTEFTDVFSEADWVRQTAAP